MKHEYDRMESTNKYGIPVMEDKSVKNCEKIGDKLYEIFIRSDLTRSELADLTGIPVWKISRVFAGDEDFNIYEITHLAGALGYDFKVVFSKFK